MFSIGAALRAGQETFPRERHARSIRQIDASGPGPARCRYSVIPWQKVPPITK